MDVLRIEHLRLPQFRRRAISERIWREWCFGRALVRQFRWRVLAIVLILLGGGLLFQWLEPEKKLSLTAATFYTWSLVFGEAPEEFPRSRVLQAMFFVVPILGLTVILEGIVDLALTVRDRRRHERGWCTMMASSLSDHIVLVGLGRLGYRTFLLLRRLGEKVVVIERNEKTEFLDELRREGSPLLIGDARREFMLQDANIAKARSIVLATNDDLANLEIALDARKLAPNIRVVLRMFDQNMADKIHDSLNIDNAMSQSAMSAPSFATAAIDPATVNSFVVGDQLVVMQRWPVQAGGPLDSKTIGEFCEAHGLGIVEHRSPGVAPRLFPSSATRLQPGDEIVAQGSFEVLRRLKNAVQSERRLDEY